MTLNRQASRLVCIILSGFFLIACGGGIEDTNETATVDKPKQTSNWDQMQWDKDNWK